MNFDSGAPLLAAPSTALAAMSFDFCESESAELSRIHALLLGRTQAELVLVERMLSELFTGLGQYRRAG